MPEVTDEVAYGPRRTSVLLAAGVGTLLAVLASSQDDRPGRFLVGFGAAVLLFAAAWAGLGGGFVGASPDGLWVRGFWRRHHYGWAEVTAIRATAHPHLGLTQRSIEIDVADRLIVLPDLLLGADAAVVATALSAFHPATGGA